MKIAIVSDVHDHINHLLLALATADEAGCERMIFLGDMVHSSTFTLLTEEWKKPLDLVFGNNEYEIEAFHAIATAAPHVTLHGNYGAVTIDSRRLFFCHLPSLARQAVETGRFDAVFYGHTHCADSRMSGATLLANPGEVFGRQSRPGIGVYDTDSGQFFHFPI